MYRKSVLKNKRGFTLWELTIVIAILGIISAMVVSFSALISAQNKKNNLRSDFMDTVIEFRTNLQTYFANNVDTADKSGTIIVSVSTQQPHIYFDVKHEATFPWGSYNRINKVELSISDDKTLLKVRVWNRELDESQSFLLHSNLGAKFALNQT